jgi:hypothetical protein
MGTKPKREAELNGCKPFGGAIVGHFGDKEHDALWQALHEAALDAMMVEPTGKEHLAGIVYAWLAEEPRTTVVCAIVERLHANGFRILPNAPREVRETR